MNASRASLALFGGPPALASRVHDAWVEFDESVIRAVTEHLTHHRSTNYDEALTSRCEEELATLFGVAHCLVGQGATECLRFLVSALMKRQTIESAVLPAHVFPGLAAVLSGLGLRLKPVAVAPDTLLAHPDSVFEALAAAGATRALALLHCPWGLPWTDGVPRTPLGSTLAIPEDTPLVVDLSHALGSLLRGAQTSICGADAGIVSLGAGKFLSGHELGGILFRDSRLRDEVLEAGGVRRLPSAYSCRVGRSGEATFGKLRGHPLAMVVCRAQIRRLPAKRSAHYASSQLLRTILSGLEGYHLVGGQDPEPRQHFRHLLRLKSEEWLGLGLELVVKALQAEGVPVTRIEYLTPGGTMEPPLPDTYLCLPGFIGLRSSDASRMAEGLEKVWRLRRCLVMG